jgi:hypothetical protein
MPCNGPPTKTKKLLLGTALSCLLHTRDTILSVIHFQPITHNHWMLLFLGVVPCSRETRSSFYTMCFLGSRLEVTQVSWHITDDGQKSNYTLGDIQQIVPLFSSVI